MEAGEAVAVAVGRVAGAQGPEAVAASEQVRVVEMGVMTRTSPRE